MYINCCIRLYFSGYTIMIKIQNLYKSFGDRVILKNLSFSIKSGECVSIIGKSGIGKSILLKHLIGLMQPDSGEIYVNDKLINDLTFKELQKVRNKISMVFQFGALFDFMNVIDNVSLPLKKLTNFSDTEIEEYAKKYKWNKEPQLFFVATKHEEFNKFPFHKGSVVVDPWRYITVSGDIKLIRIGDSK